LNQDARDARRQGEEALADIKAQGEAERKQIEEYYDSQMAVIEDKIAAENKLHAENESRIQESYRDEFGE
jgi:hypothetical protein